MKIISIVLVLCFAIGGTTAADERGESLGTRAHRIPIVTIDELTPKGPGDYARWLEHGGLKRYYEVHTPPNYSKSVAAPLVLCLHGGGGNPSQQRWQANMETMADEKGLIIVYPAGTNPVFKDKFLFWNAGPKRKHKKLRAVDDVAFLNAVLDDLNQFFTIDTKRVYATGISNGAHMSYRFASETERIAAIAPIAGVEELGRYYQPPKRGLPIIHFHGTADKWNSWEGGMTGDASGFEKRKLPAVETHIQSWVKSNSCQLNPDLAERVGDAERRVYDGGRDGSEVVFWILHDGGHTWPGGRVSRFEKKGGIGKLKLGPGGVGPVNRDINAGELMLEFFEQHERPEPIWQVAFSENFNNFPNSETFGDDYYIPKSHQAGWTIERGALVGRQVSDNHGSVLRRFLDFGDVELECDFRFSDKEKNSRFNLVFDDSKEKTVHAGHIARIMVSKKSVTLQDDKIGAMNLDVRKLRKRTERTAEEQAELDRRLKGTLLRTKVDLTDTEWHHLKIRIAGSKMTAELDGKVLGVLDSPGIDHATRDKYGFTVTGAAIAFDNWKVSVPQLKAEPSR